MKITVPMMHSERMMPVSRDAQRILLALTYLLVPVLFTWYFLALGIADFGFFPLMTGPYLSFWLFFEAGFAEPPSLLLTLAFFASLVLLLGLLISFVLLFFRKSRPFFWLLLVQVACTVLYCLLSLADGYETMSYLNTIIVNGLVLALGWPIFRKTPVLSDTGA